MKFGETNEGYRTRILKEAEEAAKWKEWFAWYPVKLTDGSCRWWEPVLWREVYFIWDRDEYTNFLYCPIFNKIEYKDLLD